MGANKTVEPSQWCDEVETLQSDVSVSCSLAPMLGRLCRCMGLDTH
jgi:hypothetical protein